MRNLILIMVLSGNFMGSGLAQDDVYYTRNATLTLNGVLNGKPLKLVTRELSAILDYETAFIIIRFPVSSWETKINSLNAMLDKRRFNVVFDGKLGMEYVNPDDHPPMKFETKDWLAVGDSKSLITGGGELHHIGNPTEHACILGLTMLLDLKDLDIPPPLSGPDENFEAIITQALM